MTTLNIASFEQLVNADIMPIDATAACFKLLKEHESMTVNCDGKLITLNYVPTFTIFSIILNGWEYDHDSILDVPLNVCSDWETHESENLPAHSEFIKRIQGIDVYHCYGADHYFLVDCSSEV